MDGCDGWCEDNGTDTPGQELRAHPIPGGFAHFCKACWDHQNKYCQEMGDKHGHEGWALESWADARVVQG